MCGVHAAVSHMAAMSMERGCLGAWGVSVRSEEDRESALLCSPGIIIAWVLKRPGAFSNQQ